MAGYDTERYRLDRTIYQWRCSKRERMELKEQAARENRTANKVLSDAFRLYMMMPEKLRKEKLHPPKNQVTIQGW